MADGLFSNHSVFFRRIRDFILNLHFLNVLFTLFSYINIFLNLMNITCISIPERRIGCLFYSLFLSAIYLAVIRGDTVVLVDYQQFVNGVTVSHLKRINSGRLFETLCRGNTLVRLKKVISNATETN